MAFSCKKINYQYGLNKEGNWRNRLWGHAEEHKRSKLACSLIPDYGEPANQREKAAPSGAAFSRTSLLPYCQRISAVGLQDIIHSEITTLQSPCLGCISSVSRRSPIVIRNDKIIENNGINYVYAVRARYAIEIICLGECRCAI